MSNMEEVSSSIQEGHISRVQLATVTPRITETLNKSLKLQLSLKARAIQVVEVGNQSSKSGVQNSDIQVLSSVDRLPQSINFGKLLESN
jgi:hypothetical protein